MSPKPFPDENGERSDILLSVEELRERQHIEAELREKSATLATVTQALNTFLETGDWSTASNRLLSFAIQQTQSQCGFLGAVLDGPILRVLAHEGIFLDLTTSHNLYHAKIRQQTQQGYFEVAHDTNLLGEFIRTGNTVIVNDLASDPRAKGTPAGHPRVHSFLGVPILKGSEVVAVIAVANRAGGYSGDQIRSLETISQTTGVLYDNYRQHLKRKELEEQQRQLESEFRQAQKMEVLGQLAGAVAHDFNNILMVISGSAELLQRALPGNSSATLYVDQIRRTTERAALITKQLLAFSRKQVLDVKRIDVHDVLIDCEFMLPSLLGSDVELVFDPQAANSWIQADAGQIEQTIINLLINARDALPRGGRITVSTRNTGLLPHKNSTEVAETSSASGWLILEIADNGCGMDEQTRAHIFEPFFTTKPPGQGTGLGLSKVYGIVHQFGGHIQVASQPGAGSRFQLFFPLTDPRAELETVELQACVASKNRALTILLADDETALRLAIAEFLRGAGHHVLDAHSAYDVLELASHADRPIDIFLTNIVMPGIRGTELAQQVAELHPAVHVIYMSGYAAGLPNSQIASGAAFLQKPFRLASLLEQLKLLTRKA